MWNKCKAILIAINQRVTPIGKYTDTDRLVFNIKGKDIPRGEMQHLYIISKDEIKLSDNNEGWFLRTHSTINNTDIIQNPIFTSKYKYKKIIATTDFLILNKSLEDGLTAITLPQISQSFIEQYITEYNKGHQITDCLVEYVF